jgi:hypothetical protein
LGKLKEIREKLARAGAPYVEMVAVMTKYNPFAEKAGMARVTFQTRGLTRHAENRLRSHFWS